MNACVQTFPSLAFPLKGSWDRNWEFPLNLNFYSYMLLLLVTQPFPRDGGMAEDHEAPEAGQLSRVWTRGRRETESRQRVSGAKSP